MISPRHPLSSPLVNVAALDSSQRLSLAVARLDDLIARLSHLSTLSDQPSSRKAEDQRLPTTIPAESNPFDQDLSLN